MPQLIGLILLVVYIGGIWKFLSGYRRTNFGAGLQSVINPTVAIFKKH